MRTRDHVRRFYRIAAAAVGLLALFVQPSLASAIPAATQEAEQGQSTPEGLFELRKRAEGGDASAQKQLADAYASGNGVRRDAVEAANWYARAADQGDHEAQVKLAALYRTGTGVESDRVVALRWLTVASMLAPRDQEAELRADREVLARELTRDQATRAEAEARAWFQRFERERQSARQSASKPLVAGSDAGVVLPRVIREVRPNYTEEALRRTIRGIVRVEAVVLPDGKVGEGAGRPVAGPEVRPRPGSRARGSPVAVPPWHQEWRARSGARHDRVGLPAGQAFDRTWRCHFAPWHSLSHRVRGLFRRMPNNPR